MPAKCSKDGYKHLETFLWLMLVDNQEKNRCWSLLNWSASAPLDEGAGVACLLLILSYLENYDGLLP